MGKKEPTYSSDEMYQIMVEFATHITDTYTLHSKRFGMPVNLSPEAVLTIWQNEMEQNTKGEMTQ